MENKDFNISFNIEKRGGIGQLSGRIAKVSENFDVDTQRIRAKLIRELEKLVKECLRRTRGKDVKEGRPGKAELKARREWARTAAYISQVINSIGTQYDTAKIRVELDEVKRMVREIEQKHRKGDQETQATIVEGERSGKT